LLAILAGSIYLMTRGGRDAIIGFLAILVGPIAWRVYLETTILFFRIYDSLRHIEGKGSGSVM